MKLRKKLIGYNCKDVDHKLNEYNEKVRQLEEDNEYLREKLEESKFMYQTAKSEYEKKIDELSTNKYSKIGDVYAETYSNVDTLYQEAFNKTKTMISKTVNNLNNAKVKYEAVINEVESKQQIYQERFYELVSLIGDIQLHMKEMVDTSGSIKSTVSNFDTVSNETIDEINKITQSFDKVSVLKRNVMNENKNKISFSEFLDNYTGEGSIVDILKLYSELK